MSVTNRGRFLPRFPTAVTPSGPITSTQVGLTLTLGADFRPLGAAGPSYDTALVAIVQDPTTGAFSKITLANLFANSQPLNTALTALATVTPAADTAPYFTGASSAAVTPFTSYGRTIVGTASASAARTALGSTTVGDALFIASDAAAGRAALSLGSVATLSSIDLTTNVSSVLPVANGGTATASYTTGDILYASGATALSKLAGVATGNALISGGVGTAPAWGKIGLATHVSGDLPVSNLNSGTGANASTFWCGDGTWKSASATAAPIPTASSGVNGEWLPLNSSSGGALALPAGGTWAYWRVGVDTSTNAWASSVAATIAAGGSTIGTATGGVIWRGACWRIT